MPYMLLVIEPQGQRRTRTTEEGQALYQSMLEFAESLKKQGVLRMTSALREPQVRVRIEAERQRITDGPFAEAKELIGGFFLLNCETREQALRYAAQCPAARWAQIEVRETGPCYE
jgi:hypothetical protein